MASLTYPARQAWASTERFRSRWIIVTACLLVYLVLIWSKSGHDTAYLTKLGIAGLGNGVAAALSGMGLVLTYRTTGVFNFAQGAIASFIAYIYWTLTTNHGWPLWAGALFAVFLIGPGIGLATDRAIFRPLQQRGASTTEKIVVSLGLTVLFIGLCAGLWGLGSQRLDSPLPYAGRAPWKPFGNAYPIGHDIIGDVVILAIIAAALTVVFRYTRLGTEIRAVVDKRELAELSAINANRISAIAWAIGCGFAGIVGVLYASTVALDPYRTTLLILNTFVVAVAARLRSLPVAAVTGLILGVAQAMLQAYPSDTVTLRVMPNVLAIVLLLFLLVDNKLDELGDPHAGGRSIITGRLGRDRRITPPKVLWFVVLGATVLAVPYFVNGTSMTSAEEMVALTVAFLSIVAITGFSGNISLCQAVFAGCGAFFAGKLSTVGLFGVGPIPVIPAMLIGSAMVVPIGIATAFPALRKRGLFLGLTTLAVGILLDAFIFNNTNYYDGLAQLQRPHFLGLSLEGDKAYFYFELVVLAIVLFFVRNLRSGRLGRILAAMRDSENGATSSGISLRKYKLFIFAASSFVAALGGCLFMYSALSFDEQNFSPIYSLFWFTAVVVGGLSYLSGAAIAAILFIGFDAIFNREGVSFFFIGLIALFIAYLPGGLVGTYERLTDGGFAPRGLMRRFAVERERRYDVLAEQRARLRGEEIPEAPPEYVASDLATDLLRSRS